MESILHYGPERIKTQQKPPSYDLLSHKLGSEWVIEEMSERVSAGSSAEQAQQCILGYFGP